MFEDPKGPITHFKRGKFVVAGKTHSDQGKGAGKDVRMVGDQVTAWEERKGHHLTPEMITGVYDQGIEVLVIGRGVDGALEVPPETCESVMAHGVQELIVDITPRACQEYNRAVQAGRKAALLAHGAC